MKRKLCYLPFLLVFLLVFLLGFLLVVDQASAGQTKWTEEKIGKVAIKADNAAKRKQWGRAIKYGEKMLEGSELLYGSEATYTITRLKTLNRYYDHAGRLSQISERVKKAYLLSKEKFKPTHNTANTSRLLYYKLLVSQKEFQAAIPLIQENISILTGSKEDKFRKLHYLEQLHGLYGLTAQLLEREKVLLELLELNKRLVSTQLDDNIKIIMNLAKTYCLQKKFNEFDQLMQRYDLKFEC
ncbi:hypothetical protein [Paremcibacter congregatus]|uniref:Uncharacterized protein n=1 Tax=Paremcibacter congregatus TaxID=2043170 RepID=A0A2G4YR30_9PROT|nr:hypothetical protein [Paremcibacter congregatus]PHZ84779.1 hypothetical protein CRD36_10130 [Paremcibacter congregatus]QDE26232.1 hypothetical protein FIV45_02520 [Paremcibacter congregatus]